MSARRSRRDERLTQWRRAMNSRRVAGDPAAAGVDRRAPAPALPRRRRRAAGAAAGSRRCAAPSRRATSSCWRALLAVPVRRHAVHHLPGRARSRWCSGLIALSLTFLGGYGGMVSLAQMTVAGIAGYALAILGTSSAAEISLGWPWWVAHARSRSLICVAVRRR